MMSMSAVRPMPVTFPESPLPHLPVPAELRFDADHPFAACLFFPVDECECVDGDEPVSWWFGRDLLNEGRCAPAGDGDVRVCPGAEGEIRITLVGETGQAVVSAPAEAVTAFLADSFRLVPAGSESEHLDIDALLAQCLGAD
ncbi:SsgA family sporulation/cell division regulator [Kitasatospora terrestris]|uniref:SsgA family sporulation/cell division regulator n=1 Tax=Kitasatospora terrestris TaxID=258051 RepID=A0ABP9DFY1_9ACTN